MRKTFLDLSLCLILFSSYVHGALELEINQGSIAPTPIAIVPIEMNTVASEQINMPLKQAAEIIEKIKSVVESDLNNTNLFNLIPQSAFIQTQSSIDTGVHFSEWRLINADKVLTLKMTHLSQEKLSIEARLFDSVQEKMMNGSVFNGHPNSWRVIAHRIADLIYKNITGDPGYFDTQILYVSYKQQGKNQSERLAIMDYDGENHSFLTDGKTLVMTPRFSPDRRYITFMDYVNKVPHVFLIDRLKNQKSLVGSFKGMTFAPRFSMDGKKLVMSFSKNGNTSLFEMDLDALKLRRLTNDPVIDTSPCYSPDGTRLVFNSDRTGRTQLYVMNLENKSMERITFGEGSYRTPVWSPRGDWIAFTKIYKGEFYIGVLRPDGSGERLITKGYLVEGPSWAPNGHALLFTRDDRQGRPRLHAIDFTGHNEREIPTPDNAVQGDWSMLRY